MERLNKSKSIKNTVELGVGKEDIKMGVIVNIQGIVFTWLHKFPKTLPLHSAFGEIQTGDLSSASWACVVSVNAN